MKKEYKLKKQRTISWRTLVFMFILGVFLLLGNYSYVVYTTKENIYTKSIDIPNTTYGLLLGTPKYLPDGTVNNYYANRIKAIVRLYADQQIEKIIISADTLNKYKEDEVLLIANDLVSRGIQASDLRYDRKGSSTWNSLQGAKTWCNGTTVLVCVSQRFHLERALYIAEEKGVKAIGYVAKGEMSNRLRWREILARVKMQLDIILH